MQTIILITCQLILQNTYMLYSYSIQVLLSNFENYEHLKYFLNVYCVMTNHTGDQNKQANHKLITVAAYG